MKIGVIGSGKIGGTLTRRLRALGHDVTVGNTLPGGPESLKDLSDETGATAGTAEEAAAAGDVVVIAVPVRAVPALPAEALRGKVVIDANNYYAQRDGHIEPIADRAGPPAGGPRTSCPVPGWSRRSTPSTSST
jgi:predicted dinucleotide-binding enzyme